MFLRTAIRRTMQYITYLESVQTLLTAAAAAVTKTNPALKSPLSRRAAVCHAARPSRGTAPPAHQTLTKRLDGGTNRSLVAVVCFRSDSC